MKIGQTIKGVGKSETDFEKFFLENYPRVKSFARRILMSEHDAEDIAQDIFLKLMDMPRIWMNPEISDRYLFVTTKNYIFNIIKHRKVERKYQRFVTERNLVVDEFGLQDDLYAKDIEYLVRHSVEQMPPQRKLIFTMSRFEGYDNDEIAQLLGISIRTVERHLYLALSDLKKALFLHIPIE